MEAVPASDTLRIHLNLTNELVLHCGNCGWNGSALDWFRRAETGPSDWDGVKRVMETRRVFGDQPVPEDWLERGKLRERFFSLFEQAKARYRSCAHTSSLCPVSLFGEVGIVEHEELRRELSELSVGGTNRRARYYLELRRSPSGLPVQVSLRGFRSSYDQIRHLWLEPEEPFLVLAPEGSLYRDWRKGVVIATDPWVAMQLEKRIGQRPIDRQPPLMQVVQARSPFLDEIPFARVLYVHGKEESPDFGLALAHGGASVRVASIEEIADEIENAGDVFGLGREILSLTTETIMRNAGSRPAVIPYLEAICSRPWVTAEIRNWVAGAVASGIGERLDRLVARTGTGTQVLSLPTSRATYACRNGIYLKATDRDRQQFEPASNFSLRINESFIDENRLSHQVILRMGADSTRFTIADADFGNGTKLMEAATKAAVTASFLSYPRLTDLGEVKLLPAIVKATQTRAPLVTPVPRQLGFGPDRFHGANYIVTASGVRFGDRHEDEEKRQAGWMLPEEPGGIGEDHLKFQANELATWVGEQQPDQQRLIGAILYATLAWLHRGSRGLASHLLLPSADHLEILGQLLGLIPIEVGRGKPDQAAVPRLMKSFYWKSSQFRRQGRIVAAIEDPNRRIDEKIPILALRRHEIEFPEPPLSYLSLLVFSCLGTKNPSKATEKFIALCECPKAAKKLERLIRRGSWFFCRPGCYLKCFLSAVMRHCDPDKALIQSRGRTLLKRSLVEDLERSQGYGFRESRLIAAADEGSMVFHPDRYGRERVPVLEMVAREMP